MELVRSRTVAVPSNGSCAQTRTPEANNHKTASRDMTNGEVIQVQSTAASTGEADASKAVRPTAIPR
jgi:hypothetical protein